MKKIMTIAIAILTGLLLSVSLPATNANAKTRKSTPVSMRGYYIGKGDVVKITKHHLYLGAPQAGINGGTIKNIQQSGKIYRFHTRIAAYHQNVTVKIKRLAHHHLHFYNHELRSSKVTKVSKRVYNNYLNHPLHGLPKGL